MHLFGWLYLRNFIGLELPVPYLYVINSFAEKRSSEGRRSWRVFGSADPGRYVGVRSSFDPLNVAFFHSKLLLDYFNVSHRVGWNKYAKNGRETNFSTHLKQFDGLTWLTLTPHIISPFPHFSPAFYTYSRNVFPHFPL